MATLLLWSNFNKRKNSTLQPDPNAATSRTVKLKDDCSLNAPVFLLASPSDDWNYCQYEGKYYFIDDIVRTTNSQAEIHCTQDHLATYKSYILNTSAYVLYYNHANTEVSDKRLATKTSATLDSSEASFDLLGNGTGSNSVCILNVTGENSCCSYAVTMATAKSLLSTVDSWYEDNNNMGPIPQVSSWSDLLEAAQWICEYIWQAGKNLFASGNAAESIRSAHLLPLPVAAIGGNTGRIKLGKYDTGIDATVIEDRLFSDGCSITIPWQATDWRRNAPYHEIYLYIPYIGLIQLSPSDLIGVNSLNISCSLDVTSGDVIFKVYAGNHIVGQYNGNMAASYAIGRSNITPAQAATGIIQTGIGTAAAIATGGLTAVLGGTASIMGIANIISGQPSCIGSMAGGATLGLTHKAVCFTIFHDTIQAPSSLSASVGTPFNGVMSLSGISGYVQTAAASVNMPGFGNDKDIVNSLLDGGVYIE